MANTFNHSTGHVINQYNFARLFRLAWSCSIDFNVIQEGFNWSGIYLFNRNAITPAKYNLLSSNSPVKKKKPIDNFFKVTPANSTPLADILADWLDICTKLQQKTWELKQQLQLKSPNHCFNNQFFPVCFFFRPFKI